MTWISCHPHNLLTIFRQFKCQPQALLFWVTKVETCQNRKRDASLQKNNQNWADLQFWHSQNNQIENWKKKKNSRVIPNSFAVLLLGKKKVKACKSQYRTAAPSATPNRPEKENSEGFFGAIKKCKVHRNLMGYHQPVFFKSKLLIQIWKKKERTITEWSKYINQKSSKYWSKYNKHIKHILKNIFKWRSGHPRALVARTT